MKIKDHYSLYIEHLKKFNLNTNLPIPDDDAIELPTISHVESDFDESWNFAKAFGNYLVERKRTRELKKRIKEGKRALDAWNSETERQLQLRLDTAEKGFIAFLQKAEAGIKSDMAQRILTAKKYAEQLQDKQSIAIV